MGQKHSSGGSIIVRMIPGIGTRHATDLNEINQDSVWIN